MKPIVNRHSSYFRGSELPRLLFLAAIMIVGWVIVWNYAQKLNQAAEQEVKVDGKPEPVVADQSIEFETVTDRTPLAFRDNAAYSLLLERARGRTPAEIAAVARRDVLISHLWESPKLYRGVPIHFLGARCAFCDTSPSSARKSGSMKPGSSRPETTRAPLRMRVRRRARRLPDRPQRFRASRLQRLLPEDHEVRGGQTRPEAHLCSSAASAGGRQRPRPKPGDNSMFRWTLIILGVMFFVFGSLDLPAPPLLEPPITGPGDACQAEERGNRSRKSRRVGEIGGTRGSACPGPRRECSRLNTPLPPALARRLVVLKRLSRSIT